MAGLGASLMPRTSAARASGAPWYSPRVGIASIMDQASLPGRAYASLGRMEDESYLDALGRTGPRYVVGQGEGDEMADAILRDPLTPVGLGLGSLLKGVRPVVGMASDLGSNAAGMAADQYASTGTVNGAEIGAGAGMGALLGLGGMAKGGKRAMISPEEREANFRNWFGDSKVVDADGNPLVVYHGTTKSFNEFDPKKIGSNFGYDKSGFFFTDSKRSARSYSMTRDEAKDMAFRMGKAGQEKADSRTIPANVSIKSPLTMNEVASDPRFTYKQYFNPIDFYDDNRAIIEDLMRSGKHDGAIFKIGGERIVVPLSPTQIKSATGNRGTFDPNDPNITHFAGSASAPSRNRAATRLERQAAQVAYDKYGRTREESASRPVSAFQGLGALLSSPSDTYYTRGGR